MARSPKKPPNNDGAPFSLVIPSRRRTARDLAIAVNAYYVYMISNRSRVVLYTGDTNDLARRVWEHQNGTIKGLTKKYRLTILVYHKTHHDIGQAIDREKEIKHWRRSKNALVETLNSKWTDLSPNLYQPREIPRRASPARMTA